MIAPTTPPADVPLAVEEEQAEIEAKVRDGLKRAAGLGVGRGYLEVLAGTTTAAGGSVFGRLEVGAHPLEPLTLFGYAQASAPLPGTPPSWGPALEAGVGARLTW